MKRAIIIGLMSGTSLDAVDAAAVRVSLPESASALISGEALEIVRGINYPIPGELRSALAELSQDAAGSLQKSVLLNIRMGHLLADAVEALLDGLSFTAADIDVIGSHGQTVYHVADFHDCCGRLVRGSCQIGEGSVIAQRTGIPTVTDFRTADIAAEGSGAPLVPILDKILARQMPGACAFQNIGGIGNVTYLSSPQSEPLAFDTGPGNMISDYLTERYTEGQQGYDRDGRIGRAGRVNEGVLDEWMRHPFLTLSPPKTTGREEFGLSFIREYCKTAVPDADLIRTAQEYTVRTIAEAYRHHLPELPEDVVVTGGGAFNPVILEGLKRSLPECRIRTGDEAGISSEYKEAVAFALMGYYWKQNWCNNVPSATGAVRPVVMGKLSLP